MTILGKILVIVNLVFTLVTGFFIVTVFVTRTNWKQGFDQMQNRATVAAADAAAWQKAAQEAKIARQEEFAKLGADLAAAAAMNNKLDADVKQRDDAINKLNAASQLASGNNNELTAEVNRRRLEVQKIQELLKVRDQKLVELEEQAKKLRDKAVAEEINAKSIQERNDKLLAELEERATSEGDKTPASRAGAGTSSVRRPPADVEGKVLEVDAKANLITISLGSDAGIATGQTLEVYRLEPKPEYLGTIQIVDARPHEAVARAVLPLRAGRIQSDDKVASRIITGRK